MFIVKVPGINGFEKTHGCRNAGNHVLEKLKEIGCNEQGKIIDTALLDIEEIPVDNSDLDEAERLIYENALETFEIKPKIAFLGGDHSVSFQIAKAFNHFCEVNNKNSCLIVFDSRLNLENRHSGKTANTLNWLRLLIESGFNGSESIDEACDTVMEFSSGKELYLSIDLSVLDSVFAPAASFSEPGGFTGRQMIHIIQRMSKMKNLRAFDLVEIDADKDRKWENFTSRIGAKILAEML